jgi:Tol biopolymer transport system component
LSCPGSTLFGGGGRRFAPQPSHGKLLAWIQQLANGHPVRITSGENDDREPSFSPASDNIVFRSDRAEAAFIT